MSTAPTAPEGASFLYLRPHRCRAMSRLWGPNPAQDSDLRTVLPHWLVNVLSTNALGKIGTG